MQKLTLLLGLLGAMVIEVVRRGLSRSDDHGLDEAVYREMHRQFSEAFDGKSEPIFRQTASVLETAGSIHSALLS